MLKGVSFQIELRRLWWVTCSLIAENLVNLQLTKRNWNLTLISFPGREPSISSDTRTDSSTDSYPYKQAHHESVVSHFSSDSQGTVIYNVDNDAASQSSRDTGSR